MSEVFRKTTDWIAHGNTRIKYLVIADKSGTTVTWTATPAAAQTLCYKHKYEVREEAGTTYYETYYKNETYGENPITFGLKLDTGSSTIQSEIKGAIGTVNGGIQVSGTGWQNWTPTSNVVSVESTGDYTGVSVSVVTNGRGGQKSTLVSTGSGGSVTPEPGPGASVKFGYAKIVGVWKKIISSYAKIDGEWKGN